MTFATSEAPNKIEAAVKEAESTTNQISEFMEKTEVLCGDIANHRADVIPVVNKLSSLTNQMKEIERYSQYLQVISRIEDFRYEGVILYSGHLLTLHMPFMRIIYPHN